MEFIILLDHIVITICTKECLKISSLKSHDSLIKQEKKNRVFFNVS